MSLCLRWTAGIEISVFHSQTILLSQSITEQDVRLQPLWHEDNGQRQTVQER
jgi:hypothetical protein